mmetsp:Transcript_7613/g.22451  ORF Transcript_7613/g.22451 Transcript_7613/m.22451 type:complete len:996 (-) Transcript_7613:119-3106(-)
MPRLHRCVDQGCVLPAMAPCEASGKSLASRSSSSQHGDDVRGDFLSVLPRHMWCWVAQYFDVQDSGASMLCSSWLLSHFEEEALWHNHVLVKDYVKPAAGPDFAWMYPFAPRLQVDRCVDWRRLLRINLWARRKSAIWVRFVDIDLRVPVPEGEPNTLEALTAELCRLVTIQTAKTAGAGMEDEFGLPVEGHDFPTAVSGAAPEVWPMRLRVLQFGGRPGPVLHEGSHLAGARVLLEFALPGAGGWPLPPKTPAPDAAAVSLATRPKSSTSGLGHWLPGVNFCSAVPSQIMSRQSTPPTPGRTQETALLRIVSLLMPQEQWLSVDLNGTLATLYQEIARMLRRESLLLADMRRPIQLQLVDTERRNRSETIPDTTLLRNMFWAQSETVHVEVELTTSQPRQLCPLGRDAASLSEAIPRARGGALSLSIRREQAFSEAPALELDRARGFPSGSFAHWMRQASCPEPNILEVLDRQTSESSEGGVFGNSWTRQASEPVPAGRLSPQTPAQAWTGRQLSPQSSAGHCSPAGGGRAQRVLALGHPGDTALDFAEEAMPEVGEALEGSSESSSSLLKERIVPHYPPRLLPRTLRTRQFEFHPNLPDKLLVGDKKGSVNILDIESDEVHPALSVGNCPLLGLVWLKSHVQSVVCGTSHSGKVMFLKYDPNQGPNKPVLSCTHTAEAFPKLSSLSANCTDDFLLASGISPNVAIYDIQTGKVLHRAHGIHEHFINISRFCHTSPHIFATASFDHTCKVWDLRQPLTADRPLKTLYTGGHNVMCVFSPDDQRVLCSGVDTRLMQFEVPSWRQTPESFPLRSPVHRERYRRSTYLGDSWHFITAATEESHMHLLSADGAKHGVIDFRGVVQNLAEKDRGPGAMARYVTPPSPGSLASLGQAPVFAGRRYGLASWPFGHGAFAHSTRDFAGIGAQCQHARPEPLTGFVQLDDADPNGGSSRKQHEFVQSIRTHPTIKNRIGVLLSSQGEQSYVTLVDIDPRVIKR